MELVAKACVYSIQNEVTRKTKWKLDVPRHNGLCIWNNTTNKIIAVYDKEGKEVTNLHDLHFKPEEGCIVLKL